MTNQFSSQLGRDIRDTVYWRNDSGEPVPPFAVVQINRYERESNLYVAGKPTWDGNLFYINGPTEIGFGGLGSSSTWTRPQVASLETVVQESYRAGEHKSSDNSLAGTFVGPVDDEWFLSSAGAGFKLITDVDDDTKLGAVALESLRELVVILDEDIDAADNSKTGRSGLATVCRWNRARSEYEEIGIQIEVWNHSESTDQLTDTFGIARWIDGHFWFFGDCDPMASREVVE